MADVSGIQSHTLKALYDRHAKYQCIALNLQASVRGAGINDKNFDDFIFAGSKLKRLVAAPFQGLNVVCWLCVHVYVLPETS